MLSKTKILSSLRRYLDTAAGQEKLDSLCMLFIAIGESLKPGTTVGREESEGIQTCTYCAKRYSDVA